MAFKYTLDPKELAAAPRMLAKAVSGTSLAPRGERGRAPAAAIVIKAKRPKRVVKPPSNVADLKRHLESIKGAHRWRPVTEVEQALVVALREEAGACRTFVDMERKGEYVTTSHRFWCEVGYRLVTAAWEYEVVHAHFRALLGSGDVVCVRYGKGARICVFVKNATGAGIILKMSLPVSHEAEALLAAFHL